MENFIDTNSKVHDEKFGGNKKARTTDELKKIMETSKSKPKETKTKEVKAGNHTSLTERDPRGPLPLDTSTVFDKMKETVNE